MKKIILSVLAIISIVVLGGCTQQAASTKPNTNEATMVSSDTVTLNDVSEYGSSSEHSSDNDKYSVYFAYDSNQLTSKEKAKIARNSTVLKQRPKIRIEGNSDEFGTDEYNYALGLRRAKAVKDIMVAEGINAQKIELISYGESNPNCTDKTQECYQKNRRADYK